MSDDTSYRLTRSKRWLRATCVSEEGTLVFTVGGETTVTDYTHRFRGPDVELAVTGGNHGDFIPGRDYTITIEGAS